MRGALLVIVLLHAGVAPIAAATLDSTVPDSVFRGIDVGKSLTVSAAESRGFEVAEALSAQNNDSQRDILRLELEASDRVCFIELSVKDLSVLAEGWMMEPPRDSLEIFGRRELAHLVAAHGFPDDVIAEAAVHAVGWIDRKRNLRLELLEQAPEGGEGAELSAVLRRP